MTAEPRTLTRTSVTNALWNATTFGLSKFVVLVTTIILARLLEPADFGLLAIGLVVIGYLDFVNDFGVSAAVIQHQGDPDRTADTAFWMNLVLGGALALIGVALSDPIATFFSEPRAATVIAVLSLSFPLTSIGSIHEARLRRELRFARRVLPEFAKGVAKGAVSITLAVQGHGVWSLVWGQLAGTLIAAIGYWIAFPWVPAARFDRRTSRELIGFGSQMTLVGLLGGLHKNLDYVVIGRSLDTRRLGLYSMAFRLPQLLIESVVDIAGQVAFPAFSRVRAQPDRVRSGLRRMLGMVGITVIPLGLGVALTADPFIRVFYGSSWTDAIPVMQVLAVYTLVQSLSKTCGDVYKAMGRPGILARLGLVKLALTLPLLIAAVPHGIVAVAVAQLASATILTTIRLALAARIVGAPLSDVLLPFVPAFRAGAVMTAACVVATMSSSGLEPIAVLAIIVLVGAVSYGGTLVVFDAELLRELRSLASVRARGKQPDAGRGAT